MQFVLEDTVFEPLHVVKLATFFLKSCRSTLICGRRKTQVAGASTAERTDFE